MLSKSTKYVRRKRPRHSHLSQSAATSCISNDADPLMDEPELVDDDADIVDVPIGRARDIAKAQPLTPNIPIIFTDLKSHYGNKK